MTIESVIERVQAYNPRADVDLIRRAYEFAHEVHSGQKRASGEEYINHPIETASILANLQMDTFSICAALLHDVVEDTHIQTEQIAKMFGNEIADLVEGVTKLKLNDFETKEAGAETDGRKRRTSESKRSAENLRKIFLAMAKDFRVMVIKLADRLHNMRTLDALPPDRQMKVATETIQIFAPLAHRLGIWQIKWQLEDLAFKYLYPNEYNMLVDKVAKTRREREDELVQVISIARRRMAEEGIKAEIQGRPKHLYSIYQKMQKQEVNFDEIYDLIAIRIIVDTVADCYHALGVVHAQWKPIPERFDDYIAKPKSNMYQSLHTKVIGPSGDPLEIQIRTWDMHRTAEFGIAAHWQYKEEAKTDQAFESKLSWLRQQLFDWQVDSVDDNEFLRSVTEDLFTDQVFLFTPKGDVIDLPAGSTPVDFAYRIHSDVGSHCAGAKVNGRIVPLSYQFKNGDIVEIISRANVSPSLDWLNFVKTSHARSKIKAYFRKIRMAESIVKGREMLEKEAERMSLDRKELLKSENLQKILESLKVQTEDDLMAEIGYGHIQALTVIHRLMAFQPQSPEFVIAGKRPDIGQLSISAGGVDGVAYQISKCCTPIPGDEVIGYVTRGRGISLHRANCPNIAPYIAKEPDRIVNVNWSYSDGKRFQTGLLIEALDRVGLLNDISAIFSETKTNISSAKVKSLPNKTATFSIIAEIDSLEHLNALIERIGGLSDVLSVKRTGIIREEE